MDTWSWNSVSCNHAFIDDPISVIQYRLCCLFKIFVHETSLPIQKFLKGTL